MYGDDLSPQPLTLSSVLLHVSLWLTWVLTVAEVVSSRPAFALFDCWWNYKYHLSNLNEHLVIGSPGWILPRWALCREFNSRACWSFQPGAQIIFKVKLTKSENLSEVKWPDGFARWHMRCQCWKYLVHVQALPRSKMTCDNRCAAKDGGRPCPPHISREL